MLARFTPYLPRGWEADDVAQVVGLVSDTHMPDRCEMLPPALFDVLRGADVLLHAGDVGELGVLDELSRIAPVIAVQGNDDSTDSKRELPLQQIITLAGTRLLLIHGHYPDRDEELAARRVDEWEPKLSRWAELGRRGGADVVVYGHTHIPMVKAQQGVLLVNPGAIASGSYFTRQRVKTVALLFARHDGLIAVSHIDLANPDQSNHPLVDWSAGFRAALTEVQETILTPDLAAVAEQLWPLYQHHPDMFLRAWRRIAYRCWQGTQAHMSKADFWRELEREPNLQPEYKARLRVILLS